MQTLLYLAKVNKLEIKTKFEPKPEQDNAHSSLFL